MKIKTLLLTVFIFFFLSKISAQISKNNSVKFSSGQFDEQIEHYLKKSKNQKTIAWILLGGGIAINSIGSSLVSNSYNSSQGYETLSTLGGLATFGSIPLFFAASNNKSKAQLVYFEKNIAMATNDSAKNIYLQDAIEYFNSKANANKTTAIVLSAIGGGFVIGGIIAAAGHHSDYFFSDGFEGLILTSAGITCGLISIPFFVRGAHLKNKARMIMRTGRIPHLDLSSISTSIQAGRYVALGISINF